MFSRFAAFYKYTDVHILNMPISRFWMMSACIDRINAQSYEEFAVLVGIATNGGEESSREYFQSLKERKGLLAVIDETPDREGIGLLKAIAASEFQ